MALNAEQMTALLTGPEGLVPTVSKVQAELQRLRADLSSHAGEISALQVEMKNRADEHGALHRATRDLDKRVLDNAGQATKLSKELATASQKAEDAVRNARQIQDETRAAMADLAREPSGAKPPRRI